MVIRHVVLRQFKEGVTAEQIGELEARTRGLTDIPGILAVSTGQNLGLVPRDGGFHNATVIDMESPETLPEFVKHPIHQETAAFSSALVETSVILDIVVD